MTTANAALKSNGQTDVTEPEFITATEAARIAGVANDTMRIWLKDGIIPGFQSGPTGKWRINKALLMRKLSGEG